MFLTVISLFWLALFASLVAYGVLLFTRAWRRAK